MKYKTGDKITIANEGYDLIIAIVKGSQKEDLYIVEQYDYRNEFLNYQACETKEYEQYLKEME
uniref:Uncharacterized protein n=1 Tax=viral metagenome TaxID=1070528 RepID=A0A6M3IKY5_9ZZZZ